jgi:hypothetical protein
MKSAFECFLHAANCERRAAAAQDRADRTVLLGLAVHWRTLGEVAQRLDGEQIVGTSPKPRKPNGESPLSD